MDVHWAKDEAALVMVRATQSAEPPYWPHACGARLAGQYLGAHYSRADKQGDFTGFGFRAQPKVSAQAGKDKGLALSVSSVSLGPRPALLSAAVGLPATLRIPVASERRFDGRERP